MIRNSAGVYAIIDDTQGGIIYIGSSYKSILNRIQNHRWQLSNAVHKNKELQERYDKGNHLRFVTLVEFEPGRKVNKELVLDTERQLIHALQTPTNINYRSVDTLCKQDNTVKT